MMSPADREHEAGCSGVDGANASVSCAGSAERPSDEGSVKPCAGCCSCGSSHGGGKDVGVGRSPSRAWWFPIAFMGTYTLILTVCGELRAEHVAVAGLLSGLALVGPRCRQFLVDITPYALIAVGYDSVRYAQALVVRAENVFGCGLRDLELKIFPFPFADNMTFPDWFNVHHHPVLDLYAAVPYFGFVYIAFLYAAYLFVVDRPRMRRYLWSLAIANYIAFAMYVFLPAAPPWYILANGCEIDLATASNSAGLSRVDELLGISYFAAFYSRAASVFGALPSMHCAFPMLGLLTAWRSITWKTRWIHVLYAGSMVFAAVYLTHHWILDAVAGWTVAAVSVAIMAGVQHFLGRTSDKNARQQERMATQQFNGISLKKGYDTKQ